MERGKDLILDDIRDGKELTNNLKEWFEKAAAKQNPFLRESSSNDTIPVSEKPLSEGA
jgi:hypothetical protein